MTVKELKEKIKDIPDDYTIVLGVDEDGRSVEINAKDLDYYDEIKTVVIFDKYW